MVAAAAVQEDVVPRLYQVPMVGRACLLHSSRAPVSIRLSACINVAVDVYNALKLVCNTSMSASG